MNIATKLLQHRLTAFFVIYLRYLIGGAMVFASIVKIQGLRFTSADGSSSPIHSANHLFETLYQSNLYWKFLGWGQLIAGLLVMTQLFSALGAVMLFPIVVNIFVITLSYYFAATPIITGLLVLANLFLIFWDHHKLLPLFDINNLPINNPVSANRNIEANKFWCYLGATLFLFTIFYVSIFDRTPLYWFLTCVLLGFTGLVVFLRVIDKKLRQTSLP